MNREFGYKKKIGKSRGDIIIEGWLGCWVCGCVLVGGCVFRVGGGGGLI